MRTTVRIDDDLLSELRERSRDEKLSLTQLINGTLRAGLRANVKSASVPRNYREPTHSMGAPAIDLDKSLSLAASLEDQQVLEKLARRK